MLALIENSGFGSRHAAPAARAIYDVYFEKAQRPAELPEQIAEARLIQRETNNNE